MRRISAVETDFFLAGWRGLPSHAAFACVANAANHLLGAKRLSRIQDISVDDLRRCYLSDLFADDEIFDIIKHRKEKL
jgi:hypothetical protein